MAKSKSRMPAGFHTVTPYIVVPGIARLIDFLEQGFGAQRREVMKREDGSVAHASVTLGDSIIEMGESVDKKSMPMTFHVYIPDVDDIYKRALAAGAKSLANPPISSTANAAPASSTTGATTGTSPPTPTI
jgi:PhnB protein